MNFYYFSAISDDIYRWGYDDEIGIIPKSYGGSGSSEKDAEQDQKIEENTQHINQNDSVDRTQQAEIDSLRRDLDNNIANDQLQQQQLDANDQTDIRQQQEIDANTTLNASQQSEIDALRNDLNANDQTDEMQQQQINANVERITTVEKDVADFYFDGTTFVIQKRGES